LSGIDQSGRQILPEAERQLYVFAERPAQQVTRGLQQRIDVDCLRLQRLLSRKCK